MEVDAQPTPWQQVVDKKVTWLTAVSLRYTVATGISHGFALLIEVSSTFLYMKISSNLILLRVSSIDPIPEYGYIPDYSRITIRA